MKQRVLTTFLALFLTLSVTACGVRSGNERTDNLDQKSQTDSIAQTNVTPDSPVIDNELPQDVPQQTSQEEVTQKQISKDEAAQIAISHAGFTVDQVARLHVDLDFEDGRYQYEVDFDQGSFEYEYNIDAKTGKVLFFDKDADRD